MTAWIDIVYRTRRVFGAWALLSLAMLTAAPLLAVTLGECEKKCCRRSANGHACCKRAHGPAASVSASTASRCGGGHANVGLARFQAIAPPVAITALRVWAGVESPLPERAEVGWAASPGHSPLSQRPPPSLS